MSSYDKKLENFAVNLFQVNAIKFGDFQTKVGLWTPVYCDLRVLVSYPKLLEDLIDIIIEKIQGLSLDIICGVPYTALPIATVLSVKKGYPMVVRRKEAKSYGTKKLIEGNFKEGDKCIIIEDVVTSGSSILETVKDLEGVGIVVTDAVVVLNREQGGENILKKNGITMHALLTMSQLTDILKKNSYITKAVSDKVSEYLIQHQINPDHRKLAVDRLKMSYKDRANCTSNTITKKLFEIMLEKETTLCIAADLTQTMDILKLAELVGPHICLFKTHIDIIEDFNDSFITSLKEIACKHNFILFEDRKLADIGKTVQLQYEKGIFHISSWAEVITAHSVMGKGTLDVIRQSTSKANCGVFLLAEPSTPSIINEAYSKATIEMGKEYKDLVIGFVAQTPLFSDCPEFIQLTPGVQLEARADNVDQQYRTPEYVVVQAGADIAVVGRGITESREPEVAAKQYKQLLWNAYIKRIT
ncbi:hypothetical protein Trydic_g23765 [Trypoxylus dichotomus]